MPYFAQISIAVRYMTTFDTEPPAPYPGREQARKVDLLLLDSTLPPDAFPRVARERRRVKDMPHFLHLQGWVGVCEQFRDWVAELDPGVHQFSERVEVFYEDGRAAEQAYYAINLRRPLARTTIQELSTPKVSMGGHPMAQRDLLRFEDHVKFDENVIGGRHLWIDTDFYPAWWFLSDELGRRVTKAKLKKLDLVRHGFGRRR